MKTLLSWLAILGNGAVLLFALYGLTERGVNSGIEVAIILLLIVNLYLLVSAKGDGDWLSLFLKRKALEEQKKIQGLG